MPTDPACTPPAAARTAADRLGAAVMSVVQQALVQPVAAGRLRPTSWPGGLRALAVAAHTVFVLAGLGVVLAGTVRAHSTLVLQGTTGLGLPAVALAPLEVALSFAIALLLSATVKSPWVLRVPGLVLTLVIMAVWSVHGTPGPGGFSTWAVGLAIVIATAALVVSCWRRAFGWWQLPACWLLVGAAFATGTVWNRQLLPFGTDLEPLLVRQTVLFLSLVAIPAATAAGAGVADLTVRAAVAATSAGRRRLRRGWPFVVLAVLVALRAVELGWAAARTDLSVDGLVAVGVAMVLTVLVVATAALVRRISGHSPGSTDLIEQLDRHALPLSVALVAVVLPSQLGAATLEVLVSLDVDVSRVGWIDDLPSAAIGAYRLAIGVLLWLLGLVLARRGHAGAGLMIALVGVMAVALARHVVLGPTVRAPLDPDALNLVVTVTVVVIAAARAIRRGLTPPDAVRLAGVLVLSTLVAHRALLADPLAVVVGLPGTALVLIGLTWELLAGSGWGNADSKRWPQATRVQLVLVVPLVTIVVLCYTTLSRDPSSALDGYGELGDLVLGTALLAGAVVGSLRLTRTNDPPPSTATSEEHRQGSDQ